MYANIAQALSDYFETAVGQGIDIAWEGVLYQPQVGRPYYSPALSGYNRVAQGPGADTVFEETGTYTIVVFSPAGTGRAAIDETASKVVAMFPRGTTLALSGQSALTIVQAAASPLMEEGEWLKIAVIVQWQTTEFGP